MVNPNIEKYPLLGKWSQSYDDTEIGHKIFEESDERNASVQSNPSTCPIKGMQLSWQNISVNLKPETKCNLFRGKPSNEKPRCILRNVSGKVDPGHLLAVMGASGAGKTTLLNTLTNRNTRTLDVSGKVKLNGCTVGDRMLPHCAYVQQDDLFCGYLTPREHLIFQAMLQMDTHLSYKERMMEVENVIIELGLSKCADTRIGHSEVETGISGGERKRLALATEILTNPAIILCDEPTSGLDSFMSLSVVSVLKKLSQNGRTVIFTIHQPSSEVYDMFDNILLLAEGRVAYIGDKEGAISLFQNVGLHVPANYNPADFLIFNLAIIPENAEECKEKVNRICDQFDKHRTIDEFSLAENGNGSSIDAYLPAFTSYKASCITQMRWLLWRCCIGERRDWRFTAWRIFMSFVLALILGSIFYGQHVTQMSVSNINGVMFILLMQLCFRNFFAVLNPFCCDMRLFLRENGNGIYRTDTYFFSKTMVDLPAQVLTPIVCLVCVYWMIGFNPDPHAFGMFILIIVLAANTSASYGYFMSCMCATEKYALTVGTAFLLPLFIFGGFFLNNYSIPVYFRWIRYFSWFAYGNEMLVINQWSSIKNITCVPEIETCVFSDGMQVIKSLHFSECEFYPDMIKLFMLFMLFRKLALISLLIRSYRKS